jgi:hypothetical protein
LNKPTVGKRDLVKLPKTDYFIRLITLPVITLSGAHSS